MAESHAVAAAGSFPPDANAAAGWRTFMAGAQAVNDPAGAWASAQRLSIWSGGYAAHPKSAMLDWFATRGAAAPMR
jgi:hypothetical protein